MPSTDGASGSETYDAITHFGLAMPGWVQALVLAYTSYGLVLVAPFFAWLWWRARQTGSAERMAAALLVPTGTIAAYVLSEIIKAFVHEQRPCRGLPPSAIVGTCPPAGDWSFPSNHSTIAAAVALGGAFAWRKGAPWLAVFAASMGFSRVFVGAHYPHDVLIGLALGAGVALVLQRYALGLATGVVQRFAGKVPFGLLGVVPEEAAPAEEESRVDGAPGRVAGTRPPQGPPPRRQNSQPMRTANAPQKSQPTRIAAPPQNPQPTRTAAPQPRSARPQNSQPLRAAAPQPRSAEAPPRPPAPPQARAANQPPARPVRPQQPRPAGPPQARAAGSPPPRPSNQAPAGPPPEVSPGDRPSRRTPGASRPTPPGRRNARRNG
ncbi:phosphatase PAP2 family protein [Amycolatopsis sp. WGS_07]|uniref:phosphatase PAP2 family protein n=1 Tax=Amycolatopsis sp. WGS_07 TaxID=3076764 RepID=UPI003873C55E